MTEAGLFHRIYRRKISEPTEAGCKNWLGRLSRKGYGHVRHGGDTFRAHRLCWELERGPIPEGMLVCHACDNPACVNIDHLWLGTVADNNRDKVRKGRAVARPGDKRLGNGEQLRKWWAGLTPEERHLHGVSHGLDSALATLERAVK